MHYEKNKMDISNKSKLRCGASLARPFELVAHLNRIDMKQTLVHSGCDCLISKSTLKERIWTDRLNTLALVLWDRSTFKL